MRGAKRRRAQRWPKASRARRTGLVALTVLFGSTAAALVSAEYCHVNLAQTWVSVLVGGGTLSALYLAWAAYRDSKNAGVGPSLGEIADQFAIAVGVQWELEVQRRRINDPFPLSVRWTAADQALADDWNSLALLATTGAGWPSCTAKDSWIIGPQGLAGKGGDLAELLLRIPTGRLVVLGKPGAGKTILMVRLVLDLLARREDGSPVPLLASLASWDPVEQDLYEWLEGQVITGYPWLDAVPPPSVIGKNWIAALLGAGLILLVLDGLDEIPEAARGVAIERINDILRPGVPVVITCRTEAYQTTVWPSDGSAVIIRAAAAIELCSLDADIVVDYLLKDAGPCAAERWEPVTRALTTCAPVAQALITPLMAHMARTIYNPRLNEHTAALPNPAELCAPTLIDRTAVEQPLFDAFIPAAYRDGVDPGHLEHNIQGTDFAWWQLQQAVPPIVLAISIGLGAGSALGLAFGLAASPLAGLLGGLASVLAVGLAMSFHTDGWRRLRRDRRVHRRSTIKGLAVGATTGLSTGLSFGLPLGLSKGIEAGLNSGWPPGLGGLAGGLVLYIATAGWVLPEPARGMRFRFGVASPTIGVAAGLAVGLVTGFAYGLVVGLTSGCAVGLAAGIARGLKGGSHVLVVTAQPQAVIRRDRRTSFSVMTLVGIGFGFGVGFGFPLWYGLTIGSAYGLALGLMVTTLRTASPSYELSRVWLALRGRLPWSLMNFLSDAHQRGVLRQAGAVYQFRHRELQRRLARNPSDSRVP